MARLEAAVEARARPRRSRRGRGRGRQELRRQVEGSVRQEAVVFTSFVVLEGGGKAQAARALGVSPRTLRHWRRTLSTAADWKARGRPLRRSNPQDRNRIVAALELFGPATGLETLEWIAPEMARGELKDLLDRYRGVYAARHPLCLQELRWKVPGAVWAMDHTEAPCEIEGVGRWALSVRDLASGAQLVWKPMAGPRAEESVEALREVFVSEGAPLVLKSDGGSAFTSELMAELLRAWGIEHLVSPPYYPRYNGSLESSLRWLKERTAYQALRAGRAEGWSLQDMDAARRLTNDLLRYAADPALTRAEAWAQRRSIPPEERAAFARRVAEEHPHARVDLGLSLGARLRRKEAANVERIAIRRALVAHGLLEYRRRRVSLPIRIVRAAKIS